DGHTAHEAVRRVHRDAADVRLAQVLRDLDDQVARLVADRRVRDAQRGVDLGQRARELDVDDGADDLDDFAHTALTGDLRAHVYPFSASAPLPIAISYFRVSAIPH